MENLEEFKIPEDILGRIKDPKVLKKQLDEGMLLQDILGFPKETMEKFYSVAHHYFQTQNYEKASQAFTFLTSLNPGVYTYWLGLGMSEQMTNEYHGALLAYTMASLVDKSDPIPHYHLAHCYHAIHDDESALGALDKVILDCSAHEERKELREQALRFKNRIIDKL